MRMFLMFLRKCFGVADENIAVSVNCYTDVNSLEDIERFWMEGLGLPLSCLKKSTVDRRPACTQGKMKGKSSYGTCKMVVGDVSVLQRIFGAIQEYAGFENEKLLG